MILIFFKSTPDFRSGVRVIRANLTQIFYKQTDGIRDQKSIDEFINVARLFLISEYFLRMVFQIEQRGRIGTQNRYRLSILIQGKGQKFQSIWKVLVVTYHFLPEHLFALRQ